MGKLSQTMVIIGEGPTEYYYFNSLKDRFRSIQFEPKMPKHTSMREFARKIEECVASGYSKVFCVIDMDNKDDASEMERYKKLRAKYAKPISKPKSGIYCEVSFFETHRCTELFFLYYFSYTSKYYANQELLVKDLNNHCFYDKKIEFFRKCKGLHSYFEKNNGSLDKAIANALRSCAEVEKCNRDYTFSQLGKLINALADLDSQK
jgi:hypothetical protein